LVRWFGYNYPAAIQKLKIMVNIPFISVQNRIILKYLKNRYHFWFFLLRLIIEAQIIIKHLKELYNEKFN